jgi:SnoaL-like domain
MVSASAPAVIDSYFRSVNEDDTDALVACFTSDAEVTDESRTRRGPEEIRAWREETKAYRYTAEVLGIERDGDRYDVSTRLTGEFPGSPVEMPYLFTLRGALISRLDIRS